MRTEPIDAKILSVPIPRTLETFVKERMATQGYHTVSEYVRALIRADQERAARQRVEAKLLEAVERGDYRDVTPDFWERLDSIAKGKPTPSRKRRREKP